MAAHVRRTRGGQSGLGGDGAIQPGEWRVKPIFCHLFLLPWTYPAGKCNQLLTHRHRRAEIKRLVWQNSIRNVQLRGYSRAALLLRMRPKERRV